MPERISVIRLSDAERDTLRGVSSRDEMRALTKAVGDTLRVGGASARTAAQSVEMDPAKFRALREDLTSRLSALSALPVADEVKAPLVEKTQEALDVVTQALTMLGEDQ